jgi:hypothetical protein
MTEADSSIRDILNINRMVNAQKVNHCIYRHEILDLIKPVVQLSLQVSVPNICGQVMSSCKPPLFVSDFNQKLACFDKFCKKPVLRIFMKILSAVFALFHTYTWTDIAILIAAPQRYERA